MVKSPITVEPWQPVAHARQLMLMHSFSEVLQGADPKGGPTMWLVIDDEREGQR